MTVFFTNFMIYIFRIGRAKEGASDGGGTSHSITQGNDTGGALGGDSAVSESDEGVAERRRTTDTSLLNDDEDADEEHAADHGDGAAAYNITDTEAAAMLIMENRSTALLAKKASIGSGSGSGNNTGNTTLDDSFATADSESSSGLSVSGGEEFNSFSISESASDDEDDSADSIGDEAGGRSRRHLEFASMVSGDENDEETSSTSESELMTTDSSPGARGAGGRASPLVRSRLRAVVGGGTANENGGDSTTDRGVAPGRVETESVTRIRDAALAGAVIHHAHELDMVRQKTLLDLFERHATYAKLITLFLRRLLLRLLLRLFLLHLLLLLLILLLLLLLSY